MYGPVSVCVCLSVTSRCSIKMDGRIELVFGTGASSDLSYSVFSRNSVTYKNKELRPKFGTTLKISPQSVDRRNVSSA